MISRSEALKLAKAFLGGTGHGRPKVEMQGQIYVVTFPQPKELAGRERDDYHARISVDAGTGKIVECRRAS